MDYETPDGSHFSLREIWKQSDGQDTFSYTSVTAFVNDNAYAGKVDARIEDVDDAELLNCLKGVPSENLYPLHTPAVSIFHSYDPSKHYAKAPSFTFEDSLPNKSFVADCVQREAAIYELLEDRPHPNLAQYLGCLVNNAGRITRLVFVRYECNLVQYMERDGLDEMRATAIFEEVLSAIRHLHELGRAHNDLNPYNVCITAKGHAAVIDLDACLPFGEPLLKGVGVDHENARSCKENDWQALDELDEFLQNAVRRRQ